jgi:hypothetical protein
MGWLEDLTKPIMGRVWQAFFGIGHTIDVHVCTSPHAVAVWVGRGEPVNIPKVAPHLDLKLRVWNKGGPDVTIIAWQMPDLTEMFTVTGYHAGDVLEKSGKVVTIEMRMTPKKQPLSVKAGDHVHMTLHLSNGIKKHFTTTVTDAQGISR